MKKHSLAVFAILILSTLPLFGFRHAHHHGFGGDEFGERGAFSVGEAGPTGPLFSGPHQQPFVCKTEQAGLGQPLVDNQNGVGVTVYQEDAAGNKTSVIAGYSKDCSVLAQVQDLYFSTSSNTFKVLADRNAPPADLATVAIGGGTVPFIVRLEKGSINRFIYGIAVLAPFSDSPARINESEWNNKLLYVFGGGGGIGHSQGQGFALNFLNFTTYRTDSASRESAGPVVIDALQNGFAVAVSSGSVTDTSYNMTVALETASMVKRHFSQEFRRPEFTIGEGGSGGALQQYVFAENQPGLLDGLIPVQSFSDMVSQGIYVSDCELLEYYFDHSADPKFATWSNRSLIEGLSASDTKINPFTGAPGSDNCVNSWRGSVPVFINPLFTIVGGLGQLPASQVANVDWNYPSDLKNIYGVKPNGFSPSPWGNAGVQYGLRALQQLDITVAEFLDINAKVGGWLQPENMPLNNFPWNRSASFATFDPWSHEDALVSPDGGITPAPRSAGNIGAIRNAYRHRMSGRSTSQIFTGNTTVPIIDLHPYLEAELNQHSTQQAFASRQRIIDANGNADNHLIWMEDGSGSFEKVLLNAIHTMDQWLQATRMHPRRTVAENKPVAAVDSCFDTDGTTLIASGPGVWNGVLNGEPKGACEQRLPTLSTSRIEAGGPIAGSVFSCALKSVAQAITDGDYSGMIAAGSTAEARLEEIFPAGVCDYSLPDTGRPSGDDEGCDDSHGCAGRS